MEANTQNNSELTYQQIQQIKKFLPKQFFCKKDNSINVMLIGSEKCSQTRDNIELMQKFFKENYLREQYKNHVYIHPSIITSYDINYNKRKNKLLDDINRFYNWLDCEYNIVYFNGHGTQPINGQQTYLVWYSSYSVQYISLSEIIQHWLPRKFKHLIIIINSCYAGNWVDQIKKSTKNASVSIIASSSAQELSNCKNIQLSFQGQSSSKKVISAFCLRFLSNFIQYKLNKNCYSKQINKFLNDAETQKEIITSTINGSIRHLFKQIIENQNLIFQPLKQQQQCFTIHKKLKFDPHLNLKIKSVYTGVNRRSNVLRLQNQQDKSPCGIFQKFAIQNVQKQFMYQGGFKDYSFYNYGRHSTSRRHFFGSYYPSILSNQSNNKFKKSTIKGQCLQIPVKGRSCSQVYYLHQFIDGIVPPDKQYDEQTNQSRNKYFAKKGWQIRLTTNIKPSELNIIDRQWVNIFFNSEKKYSIRLNILKQNNKQTFQMSFQRPQQMIEEDSSEDSSIDIQKQQFFPNRIKNISTCKELQNKQYPSRIITIQNVQIQQENQCVDMKLRYQSSYKQDSQQQKWPWNISILKKFHKSSIFNNIFLKNIRYTIAQVQVQGQDRYYYKLQKTQQYQQNLQIQQKDHILNAIYMSNFGQIYESQIETMKKIYQNYYYFLKEQFRQIISHITGKLYQRAFKFEGFQNTQQNVTGIVVESLNQLKINIQQPKQNIEFRKTVSLLQSIINDYKQVVNQIGIVYEPLKKRIDELDTFSNLKCI